MAGPGTVPDAKQSVLTGCPDVVGPQGSQEPGVPADFGVRWGGAAASSAARCAAPRPPCPSCAGSQWSTACIAPCMSNPFCELAAKLNVEAHTHRQQARRRRVVHPITLSKPVEDRCLFADAPGSWRPGTRAKPGADSERSPSPPTGWPRTAAAAAPRATSPPRQPPPPSSAGSSWLPAHRRAPFNAHSRERRLTAVPAPSWQNPRC